MRLLVVSPIYPTANRPRAGLFVHRQVAGLIRHGFRVQSLIIRPAPPPLSRRLTSRAWLNYYARRPFWSNLRDGVAIDEVFYARRWVEGEDVIPAMGRALVEWVERHADARSFDAIYAHWFWPGGAAALALGERFGWPVATIARGSELHDWHAIHPHCRRHVERVLRDADLVLANCESLKDQADALAPGVGGRVEVVRNGCDPRVFRPTADVPAVRRRLGLDPRRRYLVCCGSIIERKGIAELAEAWARFAPRHPDWTLVVVGKAVDRNLTQRLRILERVILAGEVPTRRVVSYLQAGDGYVQPSRLEGLANATMEAMAAGLPVITTDTCGQAELVHPGENGWLVPVRDVDALTAALEGLAADPDRARRLGSAARATIEAEFAPEPQVARLAVLLSNLACARS